MRSVAPTSAQRDFPLPHGDDLASRQQKMLQQRQLVLKRQHDFSKKAFGAGCVTAQLDTMFDSKPMQKQAHGWEKMLTRCGIDVGNVDGVSCPQKKTPLSDPSAFVRIRVPFAEEESFPNLMTSSQASTVSLSLEAAAQDLFLANSVLSQSTSLEDDNPSEMPQSRLSKVDRSSELHSQSQAQQKSSTFKLWRPWGGSKRPNVEAETIAEEKRVSLHLSDAEGVGDRCTTMSIGRAATPYQPANQSIQPSLLEESIDSDSCCIPGLLEEESIGSDSLQGIEGTMLNEQLSEVGDGDDDNNSVDSRIDKTLTEWRLQEQQTPSQMRGRLNRFIKSVPTPQLWKSSKAESGSSFVESAATRILVAPRDAECF